MKSFHIWLAVVVIIVSITKSNAPKCYICPRTGCPDNFELMKVDYISQCSSKYYCYRRHHRFVDTGKEVTHRGCEEIPQAYRYKIYYTRTDTSSEEVNGKQATVKTYKCQTDLCNNRGSTRLSYDFTVLACCLTFVYTIFGFIY